MDTVMDADLVPSNRNCKTCLVNPVPSHLPFKNCSDCRGKNRVKEARRAERRREQDKYIDAHLKKKMTESMSIDDDDGGFPTSISTGSKSSTSLSARTLKIQPKLLHELEGKEKKRAIREMKVSLQKTIRDNGGTQLIVGQLAKDRVVSFLSAPPLSLWTYLN
jgi:hypothetical protein